MAGSKCAAGCGPQMRSLERRNEPRRVDGGERWACGARQALDWSTSRRRTGQKRGKERRRWRGGERKSHHPMCVLLSKSNTEKWRHTGHRRRSWQPQPASKGGRPPQRRVRKVSLWSSLSSITVFLLLLRFLLFSLSRLVPRPRRLEHDHLVVGALCDGRAFAAVRCGAGGNRREQQRQQQM